MRLTKRIAILGSTGSIGQNALKVLAALGDGYRLQSLAAGKDIRALLKQIRRFRPKRVALFDPGAAKKLCARMPRARPQILTGLDGLCELARDPEADLIVLSLVGAVGLAPLLAALRAGKTVALANKEPMVMAGELLMEEAHRHGAQILPVDSEPSAIFQCLPPHCVARGSASQTIEKILLTASGGPFLRSNGSLKHISVKQALRHPNWKMGPKITIDSATLMNKGFEAIEIKNLFRLRMEQIEVLIHPQSILHSAVEFRDGSILAQMSRPDMRLPIQYALTFPERATLRTVAPVNLASLRNLEFDRPDLGQFPCLKLALAAGRRGGVYPAALSAADEVAVSSFLNAGLRFTDIHRVVAETLSDLERMKGVARSHPSLEDLVEMDQWARQKAEEKVRKLV
ncbi:MAG: 1-deoxy-D-xylulose-5-phosphate reductoisomerase [Elusimicrobia bacterium]|nr:1-deoxy-D-xylulose-5-phosphate reductoisomerase [Elusimicrobiota bacterium]